MRVVGEGGRRGFRGSGPLRRALAIGNRRGEWIDVLVVKTNIMLNGLVYISSQDKKGKYV